MLFRYTAYSSEKKIVHGTIDSASAEIAENSLYKAGFLRVLTLKKAGTTINWNQVFMGSPKVGRQALLDFTTELTILIESGLTLLMALRQLEKQSTDKGLQKIIARLAADIQGGIPFHQALSAHPKVFNEQYCSIMEANEKTGTLDDGLKQIAKEIKQQIGIRSQIQRAAIQPMIIVVLAIAVVLLMTIFVLPRLVEIFRQFGAELPFTTRLLIGFSDFVNNNLLGIFITIVVITVLIFVLTRQKWFKLAMDRMLVNMPVFGTVIIWHNTAGLSRSLSNLLGAGILLPDAINIILRSIGNSQYREALVQTRKKLVQGQSLSSAMGREKVFPPLLVEMIGVGEASGNLEASLGTVADYFETKVEKRINRLTSLLEPALILAVGLVVGLIAISLISTVYGLVGSFQG
ncbi:MAG: type II secretion system F family protein [Dehalococcoidales bacterium]|nr:type II secretion system F family protein [Dehalococcoidales bacterium]